MRQAAASDKAKQALATQIISRLSPVLLLLSATMAKPGTLHLPACVTDAMSQSFKNLADIKKAANLCQQDAGQLLPVDSMKELNKIICEAKKTETIMNHMLLTMDKLR